MVRIPLACTLALIGASALAQNGLSVARDSLSIPRIAERSLHFGVGGLQLDLSVAKLGAAQMRTQLFGDYYLTGPGFGDSRVSGGLRVTSGLAIGPSLATPSLPPLRLLDNGQWGAPAAAATPLERDSARVMLPYIGLGYTSLSARAGWGITADIGLGGQRPGERVRFGMGNPTAAQFESVLNTLRLSPVIQLGVSYAF